MSLNEIVAPVLRGLNVIAAIFCVFQRSTRQPSIRKTHQATLTSSITRR